MIRGPDVSSYQPNIDYDKVATVCDFGIVKITQGNSSVNNLAPQQVDGFVKVGLEVFLYHFSQPNGPNWLEDAAAEARRIDELADAFEQKYGRQFLTFLDVERNTSLMPDERKNWRAHTNEVRRWCREEGERIIAFYSGKYFTMDLGLDDSWQKTLLWCAQYPATYRVDANYGFWPTAILPWRRADIWQDGGGDSKAAGGNESYCPGIGRSDMNVFAGSREELKALVASAA
jgi:GH25 family lysozyme M1 (1,4-beta-N-acetylmuramidase)